MQDVIYITYTYFTKSVFISNFRTLDPVSLLINRSLTLKKAITFAINCEELAKMAESLERLSHPRGVMRTQEFFFRRCRCKVVPKLL